MPSRTPRKNNAGIQKRSSTSPNTPGWVSGRNAIFLSPKSSSPKRPRTRRTSVYQKTQQASPEFKIPITQMISPKGVQTRSRRSSMFGVYRKGGIRLIDIPITPDGKKKVSPPKTRTRRSSIYQKDGVKEIKQKTNRRTSVAQKPKDVPKPPLRRTRKQNVEQPKPVLKTENTVIQSPVVSLVDVISPNKEAVGPANRSKSDSILKTPSSLNKSQGKTRLRKSISNDITINFKTPKPADKRSDSASQSKKKGSARKSVGRASARKVSPKQEISKTPRTAKKVNVPTEADESLLITFKTPAVSARKSGRKRKAEWKISPPSKKCILDLSPVEKVPFKTPHKLDKSPVLVLTRTPLSDMCTSTPRDLTSSKPLKTPINPLILTSGKKSLKRPRSSLTRTKKVSIVSDLKSPDSTRKSLTARRRATPAKVNSENFEKSQSLCEELDESKNLSILSDSKVFPEPANVTILSEKNSVVTDYTINTTSHSSNGRCVIL